MNLEVANKLLKLRKLNNLSQEELAERLGISRQAVSKWERGEASPDTDNLIQLSNLYRVSLDELLGIDVKTFKNTTYPHSSSDINASTIRLTKSEDDELNYMFDNTSSKRVVYPKDSLESEVYPNGVEPPPYQEPNYNDINQMSTAYRQSNPIISTHIPTSNDSNNHQSSRYSKKKRKKKQPYIPPYTSNKFINWFERLMAKFKISYKGLYTFPIYAIGIALAIVFSDFSYGAEYLMGISILGIPLYYTFVKAVQKRNPNYFGYPILAIMLVLFGMFLTNAVDISALWLATIPFYYWFVNKDR
ncbi:MAG: helix-turn-helix domain-containing protein [Ruminococcus sp.]|nr:helix-turn-helix domain-containing protein [Ruminococcus sp.]